MKRCPYCGHLCAGTFSCHFCRDLHRLERERLEADPYRELSPLADELREAVQTRKGTGS